MQSHTNVSEHVKNCQSTAHDWPKLWATCDSRHNLQQQLSHLASASSKCTDRILSFLLPSSLDAWLDVVYLMEMFAVVATPNDTRPATGHRANLPNIQSATCRVWPACLDGAFNMCIPHWILRQTCRIYIQHGSEHKAIVSAQRIKPTPCKLKWYGHDATLLYQAYTDVFGSTAFRDATRKLLQNNTGAYDVLMQFCSMIRHTTNSFLLPNVQSVCMHLLYDSLGIVSAYKYRLTTHWDGANQAIESYLDEAQTSTTAASPRSAAPALIAKCNACESLSTQQTFLQWLVNAENAGFRALAPELAWWYCHERRDASLRKQIVDMLLHVHTHANLHTHESICEASAHAAESLVQCLMREHDESMDISHGRVPHYAMPTALSDSMLTIKTLLPLCSPRVHCTVYEWILRQMDVIHLPNIAVWRSFVVTNRPTRHDALAILRQSSPPTFSSIIQNGPHKSDLNIAPTEWHKIVRTLSHAVTAALDCCATQRLGNAFDSPDDEFVDCNELFQRVEADKLIDAYDAAHELGDTLLELLHVAVQSLVTTPAFLVRTQANMQPKLEPTVHFELTSDTYPQRMSKAQTTSIDMAAVVSKALQSMQQLSLPRWEVPLHLLASEYKSHVSQLCKRIQPF